jgi:hypothetical protein
LIRLGRRRHQSRQKRPEQLGTRCCLSLGLRNGIGVSLLLCRTFRGRRRVRNCLRRGSIRACLCCCKITALHLGRNSADKFSVLPLRLGPRDFLPVESFGDDRVLGNDDVYEV